MLQSIYLIRAESLEQHRCLFTVKPHLLPSSWLQSNRLLPTPHQKNRKETERNYSSVIKLLETSPSRGLPLTGPTVEPLNSELLHFIKPDCFSLPQLPLSERRSMCVSVCEPLTSVICHYSATKIQVIINHLYVNMCFNCVQIWFLRTLVIILTSHNLKRNKKNTWHCEYHMLCKCGHFLPTKPIMRHDMSGSRLLPSLFPGRSPALYDLLQNIYFDHVKGLY